MQKGLLSKTRETPCKVYTWRSRMRGIPFGTPVAQIARLIVNYTQRISSPTFASFNTLMSRNHWGVISTLILILAAFSILSGIDPVQASPADTGRDRVSCTNLLINSDMESNAGWVFGNSPVEAEYVTDRYRSPFRSALLGITTGPNQHSYSSMQQLVNVPMGSMLRLTAHVYPMSQPYDGDDAQELIIMNSTGQPLRRIWTSVGNANAWQTLEFDISEFMGMPIGIYFNVFNDGAGGVTAMYIDDVTLEICYGGTSAPTATPTSTVVTATPTHTPTPIIFTATPTPIILTATPTPGPTIITATPTPIVVPNTPTLPIILTATPTPTPIILSPVPTYTSPPVATPTFTPPPPNTSCQEVLVNGGFESDAGWVFGDTKLRGSYTAAIPPPEGMRAVRLGNDDYSRPNIRSYSSISQQTSLNLPGKTSATLTFWYYPMSDSDPGDAQEAILLKAQNESTIKVLWRVNENNRQWLHKDIDLTPYLGRDVIVYFNVFNDGGSGRAAMYLDNVSLMVCGPATSAPAPPPTITPIPSAPTPIPPAPTTPPGQAPGPAPTTPPSFITVTPTLSPPPAGVPPTSPSTAPELVTPAPTSDFLSPSASQTPLASTTPGTAAPTATPTVAYQQAIPTLLPSPTPLPEPTAPWHTALNALWYLLIFFVIILIIVIAFLMIRLLWGQVSDEDQEEEENEEEGEDFHATASEPDARIITPTQKLSPPSSSEGDDDENDSSPTSS